LTYSAVAEAVSRVVKSERYYLLERLATRIAEVCRVDSRVTGVAVTVRKLHPPVAGDGRPRRGLHRAVTRADGARRAYFGIGSNLGDRGSFLQLAVDQLAGRAGRHRRRGVTGLRDGNPSEAPSSPTT